MTRGLFRRILFVAVAAIGGFGLTCGGYVGYLQLSGNFHSVIADELFRSAQPTADDLASYVKAHGIKTVINLRGPNPGKAWYDDEIAMSAGLGIEHLDFKMSASQILSPERAGRIIALMAAAPKPILIHCQSGSDRTGLIAALYMKEIAGQDAQAAEKQLSFYYGHVGLPVLFSTYAMDRSWQALETHIAHQASEPATVDSEQALR